MKTTLTTVMTMSTTMTTTSIMMVMMVVVVVLVVAVLCRKWDPYIGLEPVGSLLSGSLSTALPTQRITPPNTLNPKYSALIWALEYHTLILFSLKIMK